MKLRLSVKKAVRHFVTKGKVLVSPMKFIVSKLKEIIPKISLVISKIKMNFSKMESITPRLILKYQSVKHKLIAIGVKMVGPIEKGFHKAALESPPQGSYEGIDLSILPKYISYKAALLREKMTLYYILTAISLLFVSHYLVSRIEIFSLYGRLREKEYILAPGVLDFTKASPHIVPDSYIHDASMDFLSSLGNISAANVDEQYASLKRFMSHDLKIQFDMDTFDWIEQVKTDNISQILKVTDVEIISNSGGAYKVTALGRVDFYADQQYLGHEDQVIQMVLKLVPPESGKRWYLQITFLSWEKAETFQTRSNLSKPNSNLSKPKSRQ